MTLVMAFLVVAQGCGNGGDPAGVENLKVSRRAKPEGILLVVRELDLGTLPLHGSLELLLNVKNPQKEQDIKIDRYEINRPGLRIEPGKLTLGPGETDPIRILVTTEATNVPGSFEWDIEAWDPAQRLAFRTTLFLIVRDDVKAEVRKTKNE